MKIYAILFLLIFPLSKAVLGQGKVANFNLSKGDVIEDVMFHYYDEEGFNGSVLVVEKNEIIYQNTFGFADFENKEPLDANTPFYLASLAKQFTAAAIIKLAEEKKLYLDDQVRKFLPYLPKTYDKVKIYHLLTHTGGVPDYFALEINHPGLTNMDVYKALIDHKNLDFVPGNKYRYSNSGYVLLALIIQVASGQTIDQYFANEIFKPFGMSHSFVYTKATVNMARVKGYTTKFKLDDYNLYTVGDGGIYSTTNDINKWLEVLNSGKFISSSSLEKLYTPLVLSNGRVRKYGYGWEIGNNLDGKYVYHTGGLAGFRNYLEQQIYSDNRIIILSNNSFPNILALRNILIKVLDGRLSEIPEDKR